MISIIAAVANNSVIGKNNKLLWNLPEDLRKFKEITSYKIIIMGRKTFESLPQVLPNRYHIVLTRDKNYKVKNKSVKVVHSLEEIYPYIEDEFENFVIGGGEIFNEFLPHASKLYITKIYKDYEGDTYFPKYQSENWELIRAEKGKVDAENPDPYEFFEFVRREEYKFKKKKVKLKFK